MAMLDHHILIYEFAKECTPYEENEQTIQELIDEADKEGLIDKDEFVIDKEDEDGQREELIELLGKQHELRDFLEVEVLKSTTDPDQRWIVEFLLTCGGPTVRVTVDSRYDTVTVFHSWGYNDTYDREMTEWNLYGDNFDAWYSVAEMFAC
jgi:hypothetical protein